MTSTTAQAGLEAVILDYNGVIGVQPTTDQWLRLARTALWPDDDTDWWPITLGACGAGMVAMVALYGLYAAIP